MNYQFNLQPWREQEKRKKQQKFIATSAVLFLALLVILGGNYYAEKNFIDEQDKTKAYLRNEVSKLELVRKKVEDTKLLIAEINRQVEAIEELQAGRSFALRLLSDIAKGIPESVFLDNIKLESNFLRIEGVAETDAGISSFLRILESNPLLISTSLDVQYQSAQSTGRYDIPPASEAKSFIVIVALNNNYGDYDENN